MDALARLGILLLATVLMLLAPPVLARRGLTSTAETIAAVGLLLVPLAGYALWAVDRIGTGGASGAVFAGLIFAVTAAVAVGLRRLDRPARPPVRHRARRPTGAAAAGVRPDHRAGRLGPGADRGRPARPLAGPLRRWPLERPVRRDLPDAGRRRRPLPGSAAPRAGRRLPRRRPPRWSTRTR